MAIGRDAFDGVNEGLRAIGAGLTAMGTALKNAAALCSEVTKNNARASYHLAGQYTYPIEQELLQTVPPRFQDIPLPGKVALFLPVTLPAVLLSVTAIPLFANSVRSTQHIFKNVANIALAGFAEENKWHTPDDSRALVRKAYGIPGLLLGGVAGLASTPFILFARFITNTVKSFMFALRSSLNAVLPAGYEMMHMPMSARSMTGFILGLLGMPLGYMAGLIGMAGISICRVLIQSGYSFIYDFMSITNMALRRSQRMAIDDQREPIDRLLGTPGVPLGIFLGVIGAYTVNCGQSMLKAYRHVTNYFLPKDHEFAPQDEDRLLLIEVLGAPGLIPGLLGAVISGCFIIAGRVIVNSVQGLVAGFHAACNVGLPRDKGYQPVDNYLGAPLKKFGFPGIAIGMVAGAFAAVIASNVITCVGTIAKIFNLALPAEKVIPLGNDTRSTPGKVLGLAGVIAGVVPGLLGMLTIAAVRLSLNLSGSFKFYFLHALNLGLPADKWYVTGVNHRPWYLGLIGMVFGLLAGACAAVLASSFLSIGRGLVATSAYALHPDDKIVYAEEDKRTTIGKLLGLPGLLLGAYAGALSIPIITLGRMVTNTIKSFRRGFLKIVNWGLPVGSLNVLAADQRNFASKTFGIAGLLSGGMFGFFGAILASTFITGLRIFFGMSNLVLAHEDNFPLAELDRHRNWGAKLLGAPGVILGVTAGVISMSVIAVVRALANLCKSYLALAGSLLNLGLRQAFFDGLRGDNRTPAQKILGGPGYIVAAITITPVALVIFAIRQIPTLTSVTLGLVFAPLVALYKFGGTLRRRLNPEINRFAPGELNIVSEASVLQGFKNMYSSLNSWGRFVPGSNIAVQADGSKSRWTFFRKSVTFNARSVAERTLDTLLADYRLYAAQDEGGFGVNFFNGVEFDVSLRTVKDYYLNGCFMTAREIRDLDVEIDKLGSFIKTYFTDRMVNEEIIIADVAPPGGLAWRAAFWGNPRNVAQVAHPEPDAAVEAPAAPRAVA